MTGRAFTLAAIATGTAFAYAGYSWYRARSGPVLDRLDIGPLGLELMAGCCAFVVFTSPSCRSCAAALRAARDAAAAAPGPTEVTVVDALENTEIALECGVRSVPTTFLITASGHVLRRWNHVPEPADARAALSRPDLGVGVRS